MSDERTSEQRDADAALEQALLRVAHAYGNLDDTSVLTDWIVVGAGVRMDDDGTNITLGFDILPDGGGRMSWHHTIGMLRTALLRMERQYLNGITSV